MAEPRLRRCADRGEYERTVDDLAVQGYKIKSRSETTAMLEKPNWGTAGGHTLIFFLTVWFTLGLGNLVYALVKNAGRDKVVVRVDEAAAPQEYAPTAAPETPPPPAQ